jgi:hypothetical protein
VVLLARLTRAFSAASLVVAALGFGVLASIGSGPFTFGWATYSAEPLPALELAPTLTTGWVLTSIGLYVVAVALSLLVVVPALTRAGAELAGGRAEGVQPLHRRIAVGSVVVAVLLLAVTVLMVWRP